MAPRNLDIGRTIAAAPETSQLELFDSDKVSSTSGVRVFDVGQGDCIGLLDQDRQVFCYVDYGGLMDHPDAANPAATRERMPVENDGELVPIVLTHWDKDHYWSANKKNPQAQQCEWLVPRQMVSPQALLFARGLKDAKCWPETRGSRPARFGVGESWDVEIRKCAAFSKKKVNEDRNKTGLAVTFLRWYEDSVETFMLLPGDCPFHLIPGLPEAQLCGLVAYHHGARKGWTSATRRAIGNLHEQREMVYSYGENEYGHPDRRNYRPDWDSTATTTCAARDAQRKSVDIHWKD